MTASQRFLEGVKIAYAAFEPFPNAKGSGTRMLQMVSALAELGAQVRFFTLTGRDAELTLPSGVEHRPIQLLEPNFLRRGQQFRERLLRELIAFGPDIVHYRGIFESQAAAAYASSRRVQRVFEVNGLYSIELGYHYPRVSESPGFQHKLRSMESDALCSAQLVLTQSQTTRAYLGHRVPSILSHCVVIPNGAELLDGGEDAAETRALPLVIYAGTLAPWQGVSDLLMAIRRVSRAQPVRLALAGPVRRRWRKQIERHLQRLGLVEYVELLGPLQRAELFAHIRQSDICVAPLRRDARNMKQGCCPIKLFEYMAAGRPVVSTDLPCVREIIAPEVNGLLAASSRPSALAEPLLRLLGDRALARRLGANARETIQRSGTWSHRRCALHAVYRERVLPLLLQG
jgi:glycosyltransferase involved in cell wall biosynthesis